MPIGIFQAKSGLGGAIRLLWRHTEQELKMDSRLEGTAYIPIHIVPYSKHNRAFARSVEFDLVADGETESEAVINLMNLLTASLSFAHRRGNLKAILDKSGIRPLGEMPKERDALGGHKLWFMPMIENARASAGS